MFEFKYVFLLFIIIASLIIVTLYTNDSMNILRHIRSHLVQLKKEVTNPLLIAVGNDNEYISNFSKSIFLQISNVNI